MDVLAARSQYIAGGEGYYQPTSGTSMATPHVAGAAALLAQKHPDWTAQQIKDALMSTSMPTPDYSPYQAGTGRLDVAAAYLQDQVVATGSVDAGLVPWSPGGPPQPITRKITYTNTTGSPVTLDLSVDARRLARAGVHAGRRPRHRAGARDRDGRDRGGPAGARRRPVLRPGHGAATPAGAVHTAVGRLRRIREARPHHPPEGPRRPACERRGRDHGADTVTHIMWVPDGTLTSRWTPGTYTVVAARGRAGLHGPHSLGLRRADRSRGRPDAPTGPWCSTPRRPAR